MPMPSGANAARVLTLLAGGFFASTVLLRAAPFLPADRHPAPPNHVKPAAPASTSPAILADAAQPQEIPPWLLPNPSNEVPLQPMDPLLPYPGESAPGGPAEMPLEMVQPIDPALPIDHLPVIMVPSSPFLPVATAPEPQGFFPVVSEPWMQRPITAGMFTGIFWGDMAIGENVMLESGLMAGGRFGWDWNDRWAWEGRLAFATLDVSYPGTELRGRDADVILFDVQLQLSPWSTPRMKPYFALGAGMAYYELLDHNHWVVSETVFTLPFGLGIKYRYDDWMVLRLDLTNNLSFGERASGLRNMHNISLVGGLEIRFGGYRRDYWPWELR